LASLSATTGRVSGIDDTDLPRKLEEPWYVQG
jgi:hypothetical protein